MESAETTSPPSRSATASATAVLPDAVGPKMATTLGADSGRTGLPANLCVLRKQRVGRKRAVLFRMRRAVLLEPGDRARDALLERHLRLVAQQLARLGQIGDVVGHLTEQRGREGDLRLDAELGGDQLRGVDERVALTVSEVDRLVHDPTIREL